VTRHRHTIPVRYGEVDRQGVVFNAHYLAWCDDAADSWLRTLALDFETQGWDLMLKKAVVEWAGAAGIGDVVDIEVWVSRWGTTSLDMTFAGSVGKRPVFTAVITYVGVAPGTRQPIPVPDHIRAHLSP
jgi:acyl-CoA thioester hydrolase